MFLFYIIFTLFIRTKKSRRALNPAGREILFCGFYLLSLNILTMLSNASDISDKLGWLLITIIEIYSIRSSPFTSEDLFLSLKP